MSCFGPELSPEDKKQAEVDGKKNSKAMSVLIEQGKQDRSIVKLLLLGNFNFFLTNLGPGASGKSTIFKQMKIIHLDGFKQDQQIIFRDIIISNVKDVFLSTLTNAQEWNYSISEEHKEIVQFLLDESLSVKLFPLETKRVQPLLSLWKDQGMQKAVERKSEYNLLDSYEYLIEHLERFSQKDFLPNSDDILRARSKTTGIAEQRFTIKDNSGDMKILMVDVGGQRNERRKWIHAFDGVTAIIYVVGLSEYDQQLEERKEVNRLTEAITLFKDIINFQGFKKKAVIIFYNKDDLFRKKIEKVDLNVCPDFKDFKDGKDYNKSLKAIQEAFIKGNTTPNREIFPQVTCATDTKQIQHVFKSCTAVITKAYLESLALY